MPLTRMFNFLKQRSWGIINGFATGISINSIAANQKLADWHQKLEQGESTPFPKLGDTSAGICVATGAIVGAIIQPRARVPVVAGTISWCYAMYNSSRLSQKAIPSNQLANQAPTSNLAYIQENPLLERERHLPRT